LSIRSTTPLGRGSKPEPFRDRDGDDERRQALRKLILDSTGTDRIDFDVLLERVLTTIPEEWAMFERPTA
jgi:hypothetical protein